MIVTFWESIKSIVPFTKDSRRASELVKELDDQKIVEDEIKRSKEVRSLIDQGLHEEALNILKHNAEDLDFVHFHKLRNQRNRKPTESEKERSYLRKLGERPPTPIPICNWTCTILSGTSYFCSNECIPFQKNCAYHSKYCCDPDSIHGNKFVKIQVENHLSLCIECFASKECITPTPIKLNRVPGVKRKE